MRLPPNMNSEQLRVAAHIGVADDTACVVTIAASTTEQWVIDKVICSYDGTPTAGRLTVAIGGVTKCAVDITAAGATTIDFGTGREQTGIHGTIATSGDYAGSAKNQQAVITLAAGGTGIGGELVVLYR